MVASAGLAGAGGCAWMGDEADNPIGSALWRYRVRASPREREWDKRDIGRGEGNRRRYFFTPDMIDQVKVLAGPPAVGSREAAADLATEKDVQTKRTEAEVAWAKVVEKDVIFNFASVFGAWLSAEQLPVTAEFFKKLGEDLKTIDGAAKKPLLRAARCCRGGRGEASAGWSGCVAANWSGGGNGSG